MRNLLLALLTLVAFAGTASAADFEDKDYKGSDAGQRVISIGSKKELTVEPTVYFRKRDRSDRGYLKRGEGLVLINDDFPGSDETGEVLVRALPPGDYELFHFFGAGTDYVFRTNFSIPFTIKAGEATYLGEFRLMPMVIQSSIPLLLAPEATAGVYFIVSDKSARDLAIARTKKTPVLETITSTIPDPEALMVPLFQTKETTPHKVSYEIVAALTQSAFQIGAGRPNPDVMIKQLSKVISEAGFWPYGRAEAYNLRGVAYFRKRDYDSAIADFTQAAAIDPYFSDAISNRGNAYRAKGQLQNAIADQSKAIDFYPDSASLHTNRALTYLALYQYEDAMADIEESIRLAPKDAGAYANRATVHALLAEREEAIADFTLAIDMKRNETIVVPWYSGRGYMYLATRQPQKAFDDFDKVIYRRLAGAEEYNGRCAALIALGKLKDAVRDCDKAISLKADYAVARNTRGQLNLKLGQFAKALADFSEAIRLAPYRAAPYYGRAAAKMKLNDPIGATDDVNTARRLDGRIGDEMGELGIVI